MFSESQVTYAELVEDETELCEEGASIEKTEEEDDDAAEDTEVP